MQLRHTDTAVNIASSLVRHRENRGSDSPAATRAWRAQKTQSFLQPQFPIRDKGMRQERSQMDWAPRLRLILWAQELGVRGPHTMYQNPPFSALILSQCQMVQPPVPGCEVPRAVTRSWSLVGGGPTTALWGPLEWLPTRLGCNPKAFHGLPATHNLISPVHHACLPCGSFSPSQRAFCLFLEHSITSPT